MVPLFGFTCTVDNRTSKRFGMDRRVTMSLKANAKEKAN